MRDPNYSGGYLKGMRWFIDTESWVCGAGPMIYVNYTIPDFILYRLMYGYHYTDVEGKNFELKSEIIDVTVPRKGSAEVFLSQQGVVTHFSRSEQGFDIPGWGYHFYENINLLQEIRLGLSSSADKEEKRVRRGEQAMEALQALNPAGLLQESIVESVSGSGEKRIQGYLGALTYNISCVMEEHASAGMEEITRKVKGSLSEKYRQGMLSCKSEMAELKKYVEFWLDACFQRPNAGEQKSIIIGETAEMEQYYDSQYKFPQPKLAPANFRYIPMLSEFPSAWPLPIDFVMIFAKDYLYTPFLGYMKQKYPGEKEIQDLGGAFYRVLRIGGYEFYYIVKSLKTFPVPKNYYELFLGKSLLTVQRAPFIKALYEPEKIQQFFPGRRDTEAWEEERNEPAPADVPGIRSGRFGTSVPGDALLAAEGLQEDGSTIDQILSLFQIDTTEFHFGDFLPGGMEEGLFDCLWLQGYSMERDDETVHTLELKVLSGNTWNISGSISITPEYNIRIYSPYDAALRAVAFDASGEYKIGNTVYKIYADPFMGDVRFYMKEGETLDFEPFCALFPETRLPDLKIGTLYASMNHKRNSWEILLGASDIWKFSMLGKELRAESVELNIWKQEELYAVIIEGRLDFLGVLFELTCRYQGDGTYFLSARTASDMKIKLSSYIQEFFDEAPASIPDGFLDFDIHELYLAYDKAVTGSSVEFKADIEHVLSITDQFVIDHFFIETRITDGKTECINLGAGFDIDGWELVLSLEKRETGICLAGGTGPGQEMPVGNLLEAFLDKMLGYPVKLPDCLSTFVIRRIDFSYEKENDHTSFRLDAEAAFGTKESAVRQFFSGETHIAVEAENPAGERFYDFSISSEMTLDKTQVLLCLWKYDETGKTGQNTILLKYQAKEEGDEITFGTILKKLGVQEIDGSWGFLTETGITCAEISYDFMKKEFSAFLEITGGSSLTLQLACKEKTDFKIALVSKAEISLMEFPVVGGLVKKFNPAPEKFSVSDITFYAVSPLYADVKCPAGAGFSFLVCQEEKYCQIYKMQSESRNLLKEEKAAFKTVWLNIDKEIAIFRFHRLGIELSGAEVGILLDAGLDVSPLSFDMQGLGIYGNIKDLKDVRFALSGIGISLETEKLSLTGSFMRTSEQGGEADIYSGCLALSVGNISAFAAGQYSNGSLMAYACVDVPLGGPPAFFIKGFTAGFGYNEALALPETEEVPAYPLITAATKKTGKETLPAELSKYIAPSRGQFFLAAGVHFTSFEIADSIAVATVSFGKKLQVGLLGLSDITMPPNCSKNPIAHARLALNAAFLPDDGVVRIEALLTSESYILSRDCKLTGGFAFYLWFGGEHAGDFVITLGGYHPAFEKPEHYPTVPRLGFCWDVIPEYPNRLVLSGELYFALTPSIIMAGGRLSAVYSDGPLCAWFIVRADFLLGWKPFHYDIQASISLGASYRVDFLFVHRTFKIELGCDLHLWGPDFSGTAHISWFIISFTISFGAGADKKPAKIKWDEFSESFLPADKNGQKALCADEAGRKEVNPLSVAVSEGVIGRAGKDSDIPVVVPEELELSFTTAFPCTEAKAEGTDSNDSPVRGTSDLFIRPMGAAIRASKLTAGVVLKGTGRDSGAPVRMTVSPVKNSVPSALWDPEDYGEELVSEVICGITCSVEPKDFEMFPKNSYLSEEVLSDAAARKKENAFDFSSTWTLPEYVTEGTVQIITDTADRLKTEGKEFLAAMGYQGECDISVFAQYADSLLDEDVFAGRVL